MIVAQRRDIELTQLTHTIATRVGRYLEHQGLLERDNGQPYLTAEALGGTNSQILDTRKPVFAS